MTQTQHAPAAATSKPSEFQRAHWYAEAADVGSDLYRSLPDTVWASHAVTMLQTFALPLAFWFKPVCVCVGMFWCV